VRKEVERLKHKADAAAKIIDPQTGRMDVLPIHMDNTGLDFFQSVHGPNKRGLS
jgi:hypothetical protein